MLPHELPEPKFRIKDFLKNRFFWFFVLVIFISSASGFLAGFISSNYFKNSTIGLEPIDEELMPGYTSQISQEEAIIKAVEEVSPAVVSIIISKDVPIIEQYFYNPFEEFFGPDSGFLIPQYRQKGTQKQEVGGGTGVIISEDGIILTNKHVVLDKNAEYTVFTNDGKKFPAKVLALDPVQDLAVIKIEQEGTTDNDGKIVFKPFPIAKPGDSDNLKIGQTVIAIGNALGEFRNTVSAGVISGLGRTITASGEGIVEILEDVIQTDAAINKGNSGGPLLNLKGEIVGINTAIALEGQSIGFAIPINKAKRGIEQIKTIGKIVYPFLGVRYLILNEQIKEEKNLSIDYGALILRGESGESAIIPNSPAAKAGLKEGDIILEFNNEKITQDNSLAKIIIKYNPEDKVVLEILRGKEEKTIEVTLTERTE